MKSTVYNLMKTFIIALMFAAPLWAGAKFPGCHPTEYTVPYCKFKKRPIYTPSLVPKPEPIDVDLPIVKRCPSYPPAYPPYGGFPRPGGMKYQKNKNVFQGAMYGSKGNMSAGGSQNVNSNSDKKVKIRVKGGKKKKRCKKKRGKKGRRPGRRPKKSYPPYYGYPPRPHGGMDIQKNKNVFHGHMYGSKMNMSAGGNNNVNSNSEVDLDIKVSGKGGYGHGKKGGRHGGCGYKGPYGGYPHPPVYGRPGFKYEDNKNVFSGTMNGSEMNMSAGGSHNVNSNSKQDVKVVVKPKRHKKKKCKKK